MPAPAEPLRQWASLPSEAPLSVIQRNVRISPQDVDSILVPGGECFDLENHPLAAFVGACRSPEGLADAVSLLEAIATTRTRTRSSGTERAVYIIQVADDPICKIGVSANPLRRALDLQAAHYREIFLWAVLFCPTRKSVSIEQKVLGNASADGTRLMGEWVAKDPLSVLMETLTVARDNQWPVCDGRTWFRNMVNRTVALHSRQAALLQNKRRLLEA